MNQISVIIPVYNAEKTLTRCLDSVMQQTYKDFEVILINDGSKDNSPEICQKYCEMDQRIKVIHQKNAGPSKARNRGIDESNSKYLTFIDSDDYIEPDMLERLYEAAEESSSELTICGYYTENENGNRNARSLRYAPGVYRGEELKKITLEAIDIGVSGNIPPYSWIRLIKRECMENPCLRFHKDIYRSEDYLIWNLLFQRINSLHLITDKPLYHYIANETSITHRYIENYWEMSKKIYDELKNVYRGDKAATERLDIMLMRRAYLSLSIITNTDNRKIFFQEIKKVLSDKKLYGSVDSIPFKTGIKKEKARYILLKFRLCFIIKQIVTFRYLKNTGR